MGIISTVFFVVSGRKQFAVFYVLTYKITAMPKRSKANNNTEADEPKRRSQRLVNKPNSSEKAPKPKKAPAKPKKSKTVEKAKPVEEKKEEEVPAENGEAKLEEEAEEEAPATEEEPEQKDEEAE